MKLAPTLLGCLGLFNPQTSKVTPKIAYYAFVASLEDYDEILARIKSWPKPKAEALSRLLSQGFGKTKFDEDFQDRPMVMTRVWVSLENELADALGLREYTQVMTGKIGKLVSEGVSYGTSGAFEIQFYPEGRSKPSTFHFNCFSTVGYVEGDEDRCPDIPWRIHLLADGEVGKVEFLGVCPR